MYMLLYEWVSFVISISYLLQATVLNCEMPLELIALIMFDHFELLIYSIHGIRKMGTDKHYEL